MSRKTKAKKPASRAKKPKHQSKNEAASPKQRTKKDPWYMQYMDLCNILNDELKSLGFEIDRAVWLNPRATILTEAPDMMCSICGKNIQLREIVLTTTLHWSIKMGLRTWLIFKNPEAFDYMTSGTLHAGAVLCLDRTTCHDRTQQLHEQFLKDRGSPSQKDIVKAVKLFDDM